MSVVPRERVLVVLDDALVAAALLEASCALAQLMQRELQLVYVESAAALAAAALPATRVLASPVQAWAPLAPQDVERGWRVQTARLRTLADRASTRHAVSWSMRVLRGALPQAALALREETDLLLVGASPGRFEAAHRRPRPLIVALDGGAPGGAQAMQVATQLAHAIGARLEVRPFDPHDGSQLASADLIVLPATALAALPLGELRTPLLIVGAPR